MTKVAMFLLAAFTLLHAPLFADTVKLKNGDRITGKVVNLLEGKLTIKTDAMGEIKIDVAQIDTIATDEPLSIDLPDGSHLNGKAVESKDGVFAVDTGGGTPRAV